MTDFASKYAFALADSDSDEDVAASAAISSTVKAQEPATTLDEKPDAMTASALFGGSGGGETSGEYTALGGASSLFDSAPPLPTEKVAKVPVVVS